MTDITCTDGCLKHTLSVESAGSDGTWLMSVINGDDDEGYTRACIFLPADVVSAVGRAFLEIDGPRFDNDPRQLALGEL
jgi:hypothetical protein